MERSKGREGGGERNGGIEGERNGQRERKRGVETREWEMEREAKGAKWAKGGRGKGNT